MNRTSRALIAALAVLALAAAPVCPTPAVAATPSPNWEITDSACWTQPINWWGGVQGGSSAADSHPSGTVSLCWETYWSGQADTRADYHAMVVRSTWTSTGDFETYPASMYQSIRSNRTSMDNYYSATASKTSNDSCAVNLPVSVSIGPVSIGTDLRICRSFGIRQYDLNPKGVYWYSEKAGGLRQVETTFMQKVPKGTSVCLTAELGVPQYDNTWNGLLWDSTAHLRWSAHQARCSGTGGSGGGSEEEPDTDPITPAYAEPAMVYAQSSTSMKIFRWVSTGTDLGRLGDYESGVFHLSNVGNRVAAGDVDGDGDDDIVMAYQEPDNTFSFFVFKEGKRSQGRWYTSGTFGLGAVAGRLVVGDFTGDGRAEPALVRDNGDGTMKIYRWQSTGSSFTRLPDYQSGTFRLSNVGDRVAAGDVDGDGDDDIVMAYQEPDNTFSYFVWKEGVRSQGRWYTSGTFGLGAVAGRLVVGDFTGDGRAEPAVARDNGDGTMKIYRWQSTGSSFSRAADYQSGTFRLSNVGDRVAAGDLTGDGRDDIVMAYQNDDGTMTQHIFRSGSSWAGRWYTGGQFSAANVDGRLVVGDWA